MQAITHFLVGILIQKELSGVPLPLFLLLIPLFGIISHIVLDIFARFTYHPPKPEKSLFWKIHFVSFNIAMVILFVIKREYWFGMLSSVIPDLIDWFGIRPYWWIKRRSKEFEIKPVFHSFIDALDPFKRLPSLRDRKFSTVFEILLICILLYII